MHSFYGRSEVLDRARALVARTCAGEGGVLLFTGEPGIGKSRLAEQVAALAEASGAHVATGRSWEAGGAPAYWPWIQVFRDLGLDAPFSGAPQLAVAVPEARFAVFDRAVQLLLARTAERPLVLVLDDLHAADAPSLLLLRFLAREAARAALLIIGTYRDAELELAPQLAPLLAAVAREAHVVALPRLRLDELAAWLEDAEGSAAGAEQLYRLTEGHPLFVSEALRLGRSSERQSWTLGRAAVLDERLGCLTPRTRSVLAAAAVLGRDFSSADLAAVSGETPDAVHEAVREGLATNLLVPAREQLRFSHVLLRDRLYAELRPSERAALHARAGSALLERGAGEELAVHHFLEAGSAAQPERVAQVAERAAQAALSRFAFEQAVDIGRRALRVVAAPRLELLVAEASLRLGEAGEAHALCVRVAERAEQAGDAELLARAALVYGTELASGRVDPQMVGLLRKAHAALGDVDSPLRVRVLARLSAALTPPLSAADGPEILALMRESIGAARRLGDRHALLYALQFAATVGMLVPERERFGVLEETIGLARELREDLALAHTLPVYLTALLGLGERAKAHALMAEYAALVGQLGHPLGKVKHLLVVGLLCALRGEHAWAEIAADDAARLSRDVGSQLGEFLVLIFRLANAQMCGRPDRLAPYAPAVLAQLSGISGAAPHVAWFLAGVGRTDEARERLRAFCDDPAQFAELNVWELTGAGEACVLLRDLELAARVYPAAVRAVDRMFWTMAPGSMVGPIARVLGDLASLLGRDGDAVKHYDDAIAFCERLGATWLVEQCQRARDAVGARAPVAAKPAASPGVQLTLRREGELWTLTGAAGSCVRLKHGKGLVYLQHLMERPGRELHVLALAGIEERVGDAGVALDAAAKAAYRARVEVLRDEMAEAERLGDADRIARAREELEAIGEQLAQAVGLGGRDRKAASDVERTRINVQRRLKDVIERVAAADPGLGRYLAAAVKTGTTCVYEPL